MARMEGALRQSKSARIPRDNDLGALGRVLDVGCGPGTNASCYFLELEYLEIDLGPSSIEPSLGNLFARERCKVTGVVGSVHDKFVHTRRVRRLADLFAALIPEGARVLDVGCGDGMIDRLIMDRRSDLSIQGIEAFVRNETCVPVRPFDGLNIPYPNASFDIVMFVDVLHHTSDPTPLLREAKRVGKMILLKDHLCNGLLAYPTLRFMDWVGNAHHGVPLPYNYWSKNKWSSVWAELDLSIIDMNESLGLYQVPASWVFDRGLHFIARIDCGISGTKDLSHGSILNQSLK